MDEAYLQWLRLIPDVSRDLALQIAERFPDFERLRAAYFAELTAIPGLDANLARRILEAVRSRERDAPAAKPSLFLCPECGSFVPQGAKECDFCGVEFEGEEPAPEDPGTVPIESIVTAQGSIPICARCGAFLSSGRACPICGAEYGEAQVRLLPRWSPLPPLETSSLCSRCGAYLEPGDNGCAICGTAVGVAAPEPRVVRGVGRDFLSRWKRVAEPAQPAPPPDIGEGRPVAEPEVAPPAEPPVAPEPAPPPEEFPVAEPVIVAKAPPPSARIEPEPTLPEKPAAPPVLPPSEPPSVPAPPSAPSSRERAEIERAIAKYEVLLRTDPTLRAAWEIRGDLLARLGRTADAEESYRRAAAIDLPTDVAWSRATAGFRSTSPAPSPPPGAGRAGRTNGRVNGSDAGRINGRVNGRVNGLMERAGAVNGARAAQALYGGALGVVGRTNGLINGSGFTNGRRGFPSIPRRSRADRMRSIAGIAAVVVLMLVVPVLASLFTAERGRAGIVIDGNFGDWAGVRPHPDSPSDALANADVNLIQYKVTAEASDLAVYAQVAGTFFTGTGNGSDSFIVLVDADGNPRTGYALGPFGADELVEVYGWDGVTRGASVYHFASVDRNDWRGFISDGPVEVARRGGQIELRFAVANPTAAKVLVAAEDARGTLDRADAVARADYSSLGIDQAWSAPDVFPRSGVALTVDLSPNGGAVAVTSVNVSVRGSAQDADLTLSLYQDTGNGAFDAADVLLGTVSPTGRTAVFPASLSLATPARFFVRASTAPAANGTTLGLAVSGIATNATPSWNRERLSMSYVATPPTNVTIDGAFGDWRSVALGTDAIGDVANRTGATGFQNDNIDLTSMGSTSDGVTASFFLGVVGRMLGGADLPNVRARTPILSPDADSDRDSVPDRVEFNLSNPNLRFDFNNDNITDAAQRCDVDQDAIIDHGCTGGTDLWLNTTIPAWYPAPYAGRAVSVYIGPIAPEILVPADAAYVYLDADNDSTTGLRIYQGTTVYGADLAVAVLGRGGLVISTGLYRYNASSAIPFTYLSPAVADVDATRLEVQIAAASLSANYRSLYYMAGWTGSYDIGIPLPPARVSPPGILSIAGDQPVLNEISSRLNPEWVELANPTASAISLANWQIQRLQRQRGGSGWTTIYTFPSGSTIGPWGSGSEYLVIVLPSDSLPNRGAIRLVNAAGITIDQTTYLNVANGRTWARFKDPTTGKPMDSDNDASDFYTSLLPSRGRANDRHRPVIVVAKTVSPGTAAPGDSLTYEIYYNNTGTGRANSVWVNDTLPSGVTFSSSSVPPSSVSGSTYRWIFTNVAPGSTNLLTVTVEVNPVPDLTLLSNTVTLVYTDQLNRRMGGMQAWANATVLRPVIVVSKVASVSNAQPGDVVTYTIFYNNTGSTSAYNVVVTDTLPVDVTFLSSSIPWSSVSGRTYTWDFGTVTTGPHSFTITVSINLNAPGPTIVNWAFVNYTTAAGFTLEPSSDAATISIPELADLAPTVFLAVLGFALVHRRAGARRRGAGEKRGVADSVPDNGGR